MKGQQDTFRLNPLASALAGAMAAFAMQGAAAQEGKPAAEATAETKPVTLQSVTVTGKKDDGYKVDTAQSSKFTAPLLDTPKSVTVVPAEVVQQTGSGSLQDALRTTPGITFGAGEGGNPIGDRPFIRGFDSMSSIYVDGVRDTASQTRDTFNIDRIEVIKGPSSAFGGKGSAGGMINIVSKLPTAENFTQGSLGVGTDSYFRATADGNYVLNDNTAVRLNAMGQTFDVPGRNEVDQRSWGFAPSVTFGLNSPTQVTLQYYHLQGNGMPDYSMPYNRGTSAPTKANPIAPVNVDRNNFYGLTDRDFQKTQSDIATAIVQHDFRNGAVVRNTTRWGRASNNYITTNPDDSKGNVANGYVYRSVKSRDSATETLTNATDLSMEFRTGPLKHNASFGFEFSRDDTDNSPYNVVSANAGASSGVCNAAARASFDCTSLYNPTPNDPWRGTITKMPYTTTTTTNTQSVYLFDTIEITRQWLLNGGVRYDNYDTHAFTNAYTNPNTRAAVAQSDIRNKSGFFNYQAGIVFKPVEQGSIYVSYGTASTPPGASNGDGADNITAAQRNLDPETARAIEIGTKWDVLARRLSLTGAIFQIEKNNARVAVDANTTINAGKQRVKGFELGFAGNLTDKWGVFGGYTYLDSELIDNGPQAANAANNGNQFPNTPKNTFSLWTTYQVLPALTVGGGAYYVDKVYGNAANSLYVPSYWRFDLMGAYRVNKNLTLQLNIQNLFDKTYYTKAYASHYAALAPGRFGMLTANFRF
ncbi:putative TonB-dependent receptor BfrD [Cupriavidus yeoncheonensis]|uniref:TonB-dependent receptor BfrD n=1 Tax=Cupriavidus yeoncheonensis TaxID=1462994 RepID=A0A916NFA5_9BURK|nr:TonB-dependent siderophore receptor [Cupriavidus yeoncheonensis]CAG2152864.1 putative TonB-dependent receptor BfrD [Cupriavidus yeoncheonensis]